jgi:hypothetical protein
VSLRGLVLVLVVLWLAAGLLGALFHLLKALLFLALLATLVVLVLGRSSGPERLRDR